MPRFTVILLSTFFFIQNIYYKNGEDITSHITDGAMSGSVAVVVNITTLGAWLQSMDVAQGGTSFVKRGD